MEEVRWWDGGWLDGPSAAAGGDGRSGLGDVCLSHSPASVPRCRTKTSSPLLLLHDGQRGERAKPIAQPLTQRPLHSAILPVEHGIILRLASSSSGPPSLRCLGLTFPTSHPPSSPVSPQHLLRYPSARCAGTANTSSPTSTNTLPSCVRLAKLPSFFFVRALLNDRAVQIQHSER